MNDYDMAELNARLTAFTALAMAARRPAVTIPDADAVLRLSLAVHRASQSMQELAEARGCASQLRVRALTAAELGA